MKVLILANLDMGLYKFRKEFIQEMICKGYEVAVSVPDGEWTQALAELGCEIFETPIERRGMNPLTDYKLLRKYKALIKTQKPDCVVTYTIKPNIYGGIAAAGLKVPYVATVTGLGSAVQTHKLLGKVVMCLYRYAFRRVKMVFFQNKENKKFFSEAGIASGKHKLVPGSGVNLEHFEPLEYPGQDTTEFVMIARIMKEKGIEEYLEAAQIIKEEYPNTVFHICGFCEETYEEKLKQMNEAGVVCYHGVLSDVREILKKTHCTVQPSYHEGMSNVLLESAACARPVIASDIPGCRETFEEGVSGFAIKPADTDDLVKTIKAFLQLSHEEKEKMGIAGRKKIEKEFSRKIVIDAYMEELGENKL